MTELERELVEALERLTNSAENAAWHCNTGTMDESIQHARAALSRAKAAQESDAGCPVCRGRTFTHVDEQRADGSFGPGPLERCVNCKATRPAQEPDEAAVEPKVA